MNGQHRPGGHEAFQALHISAFALFYVTHLTLLCDEDGTLRRVDDGIGYRARKIT